MCWSFIQEGKLSNLTRLDRCFVIPGVQVVTAINSLSRWYSNLSHSFKACIVTHTNQFLFKQKVFIQIYSNRKCLFIPIQTESVYSYIVALNSLNQFFIVYSRLPTLVHCWVCVCYRRFSDWNFITFINKRKKK
jgi:hypothetical protein